MKLNKRQWSGLAIVGFGLLMILMLVSVWACAPRDDEIVALGVTHFSGLDVTGTETDLLVVDQTSTGDIMELRDNGMVVVRVADGGAVTAEGTLAVTGNATFSTDVVVDDTFNIDDTASTITGTQTLTPTASVYLMNPASTLTLTLATGGAAVGDFLWITNITSTADVVIVDTGATAGGGNRTVSQNDVIGFIYANTKWLEAFYSDNS